MFKHTYQYAYQIELPSVYNNVVNCYLLEYESHYILIDTGENTDAIIAELKSCNVDRVFLIGYDPVFSPNSPLYSLKEKTKKVLNVLKENGLAE